MTEASPDLIRKKLKPYRRRIDALDAKLLKLIGERFGIVREVAKVKIAHDIPSFLGDRVDEVRENAVGHGLKYGIDPQFIRTLYTLMIYQSCALEDVLKLEAKQGTKKGKKRPVKKAAKKTVKKTVKKPAKKTAKKTGAKRKKA